MLSSLSSVNFVLESTETYKLSKITHSSFGEVRATFVSSSGPKQVMSHGGSSLDTSQESRETTLDASSEADPLVVEMIQSAMVGKDLCVIGGRGEGKSYLTRQFAKLMGYTNVETLFLFEDMTARDLLQRRSTNKLGESIWQPTPLTAGNISI